MGHSSSLLFDQVVGVAKDAWVSFPWSEWRDHHSLVLVVVLAIFWPIILSLLVTIATAWAWAVWMVASSFLGLIQFLYVTYQFVVIFLDVVCLSTLKVYNIMRHFVLYHVLRRKRGRRNIWRKMVDRATNYQQYLRVRVEPKEEKITTKTRNNHNQTMNHHHGDNSGRRFSLSDVFLRRSFRQAKKILRSRSYGRLEDLFSGANTTNTAPRRNTMLARNHSFVLSASRSLDDQSVDSTSDFLSSPLEKELGMTGSMLITTTMRLREARMEATDGNTADAASSLKYLLTGVMKRNHLTLDDIVLENARSVAESGRYNLTEDARDAISEYYQEVETCLKWIAESPLSMNIPTTTEPTTPNEPKTGLFGMMNGNHQEGAMDRAAMLSELKDRIVLIRKTKQNMGRTALMLSGGGAQAMYHLGTIRALIDSKLYNDIKVISGTSGGSITAAMCAIKTPEELWEHVCVKTISTDYMLTGRMKKENIRWFPSTWEMGLYWLKHNVLVDSADFKRCCDFYYGDMTFEEAFERTGKHVCITVSASRATGGTGTVQRLLLNHISTPHVTISSAVAASCALPGVMLPTKLLIKDKRTGKQEPFEVDGVDWIDGSIQADLPFQRISTLFNVSNYVVGQANFLFVPLLAKEHHPDEASYYWRFFQTVEWDIRNRVLKLSRLGLFPRIFGQDISKVFKQKYYGNLTLVPRFTAMQTIGLQALANPTVENMAGYLRNGQVAAWPYLSVLRDMVRLEVALDKCLAQLQERRRMLMPEDNSDWLVGEHDDDLDSFTSSSLLASSSQSSILRVKFFGGGREAEKWKQKVMSLERENFVLKQQLDEAEKLLARNGLGK